MNKKVTALVLAAAVGVCACAGPALAANASPGRSADPESGAAGSLSFDSLEGRLRADNLNMLTLEETIASVEVLDYEAMYDDVRDALNQLSTMQWYFDRSGDSYAASSLGSNVDALEDTLDDLKDGEIQKDNADIVRQLENAQDQTVAAAESLYIALKELELNDRSLTDSQNTLDRTIREMELRRELGQISQLTLEQLYDKRTALVSGQKTLRMNLSSYTMQLELMLGADLTGETRLGDLPAVTQQELNAMDLEADLAAAREVSYSLYSAALTLEDAQEDFKDAGEKYLYNEGNTNYISARHTLEAARYTYDAALQNFEASFRILYLQVKDNEQALQAARSALESEERNYSAELKKYELGSISRSALADAEDKVTSARTDVESAELDLFSTYNTYRWAVDYGILN